MQNTMTSQGYSARIEYEAGSFTGHIAGIRDNV